MSPRSSSRGWRGVTSDEASLREVFSYYDRDGSGSVNKGELICILSDLGALDGLHPADAAAALDAEYLAADGNRDGCLLYTSPSPRDVEEPRMPSSA